MTESNTPFGWYGWYDQINTDLPLTLLEVITYKLLWGPGTPNFIDPCHPLTIRIVRLALKNKGITFEKESQEKTDSEKATVPEQEDDEC